MPSTWRSRSAPARTSSPSARRWDKIIEKGQATWPQGTQITKVLDKSRDIEVMIADLETISTPAWSWSCSSSSCRWASATPSWSAWPSLFDADLFHHSLHDGYHPEHGRPLQPDPGAGHAGRQRHRHHREHLPLHAAGREPGRRGKAGDLGVAWPVIGSTVTPLSHSTRCSTGPASWASSCVFCRSP